jgi:hypothetical protein
VARGRAVVAEERLGAANAVFGAVRELGQLLGPVCAAGLLLAGGPGVVLVLNALTFAASCGMLARLRGHVRAAQSERAGDEPAGGGVLRLRQARRLILTSGPVIFTCGTTNVAELVLARTDLHAGGTGFGLLVSAYACGELVGSLLGNLDEEAVVVRYLAAIAALGLGLLGSAAAPTVPFALVRFALAGAGNGQFVVVGRLLLTRAVPDGLHGRAFGVLDAVDSWGFGAAVLLGGALVAAAGGRVTFALAGAATLFVFALAALAARSVTGGVTWAASGNRVLADATA